MNMVLGFLCFLFIVGIGKLNFYTEMETFDLMMMFSLTNNLFAKFVLIITILISFFSIYYMNLELNTKTFYFWMYMFVLSMMILLFSNNWLTFFVGWDGLGVTSFMLVCFYNNYDSLKSSIITFFTNRMGDAFLFIYLSSLIYSGGLTFLNKGMIVVLMMCMMTKSAQMPFSAWLPRAMAAPTPISSLVHSSTLVTAGLIMVMKNYHIVNNKYMNILFLISLLTIFVSSLMAMMEIDFKKIIALSTLSQMGLINMMISLNMLKIAFFHMITHAVFKASMFFGSGMIIHYSNNEQMKHKVNVLQNKLVTSTIILSNLALMSLPFTLGFFSKDLCVDSMVYKPKIMMMLMYFLLALTVFYSFKFIKHLMLSKPQANFINKHDNLKTSLVSFLSFMLMMLWVGPFFINYAFYSTMPQYSHFKIIWLMLMVSMLVCSYKNVKFMVVGSMFYLNALSSYIMYSLKFELMKLTETNITKWIELKTGKMMIVLSVLMNKNTQMMIIDMMFMTMLLMI